MLKVLIVDDHALVRRGLIELLRRELPEAECGEAEDAEQALSQVKGQGWDLVVLDVSMPGRSGIEVLPDLKRAKPELPVLVLSMQPEGQYAKQVLKVGASGYIHKNCSPQEFIGAIRKALAGGIYLSAAMAAKLGRTGPPAPSPRLPTR
jgi:DNA-binding NarL/FixJ family response regulator